MTRTDADGTGTESDARGSITRRGTLVLGNFIDALDHKEATARILSWGRQRESRTVCLCNVHSSVTALDDPKLAAALADADMVLPDGAPVAWMLRRKGFTRQPRVAGPDLMQHLCEALERDDIGVFLFGASETTLASLTAELKARYPDLPINGALSPMYGQWSDELERQYVEAINASGAGIIFVGLGCPRQEIWMAKEKANIQGVMLGVGAAFDFHAGTISRAPVALQRWGLEWLHRLASEPRRLWRRYLVTNSRFIVRATGELIRGTRRR